MALEQALREARYKDLVEVEIEGQSITLAASLDQQNGGIRWNSIDNPRQRYLQTKRWIFPMLNDHRRNTLYAHAIQMACDAIKQEIGEEEAIRVLDIGSGTGLLAMIVADCLRSRKHQITSVEMSTSMASLAKQTIADNKVTIRVVEGHSTSLTAEDIGGRAHLCVSELLESGLVGEGLLPSMRHAWQHLLEPTARVVPCRARVYAAIVAGEWLDDYVGPRSSHGDLSLAVDQRGTPMLDAESVVLEVHADKLLKDGTLSMLSEPLQVLEINLVHNQLPDESGARSTHLIRVKKGTARGILVWWELDLSDKHTYSMKPGKEPWQDHWHQCLQILPEAMELGGDETLTLQVFHDDSKIRVQLSQAHEESNQSKRLKNDPSARQCLISPERACQLNDRHRIEFYRASILVALEGKGPASRVLDLSDFCLGACLAAKAGARAVTDLESSSSQLPMTAARVAQLGNNLPLDQCHFEMLQTHAEHLSLDLLAGVPASIVVAEPYYEILEGWHLEEAFNYFYLIRALRERELISEDAALIPEQCRILACGIESEQLRSAYRQCGSINNLDHSAVDKEAGPFSGYDLPLPMWQYSYQRVTATMELAVIDYQSNQLPTETTTGSSLLGRCDAVMIWLEYKCGNQALSTDRQSYRQVVRMLDQKTCDPPLATRLLVSSAFSLSETVHHEFHCSLA